jgi:molybdopterin-synthase adenylyltransferase
MSEACDKVVLLVGVGGLGAPAALALAREGVAGLTLVDPDPVELSNLPRQVIYREHDRGFPKVAAAARQLREINPAIRLTTRACPLDSATAPDLLASSAFVIDATDDPVVKFLINDLCVARGTPFVYGGVVGMTGQAMTVVPHHTACLRCLFEEPPDADEVASCRDAGIIGPVAGAIGEAQAAEVLRYLHGLPLALAGRMLTYDGRLARVRVTEIAARPGCACGAATAAMSAQTRTS